MIFIKFIFPQNYNFKPKFLGIIDYSITIFCLIWCVSTFLILKIIFNSLQVIISLTIILDLPVFLLSFIGFQGENIGVLLKYFFLYLIRPKIYVFNKKTEF